MENRLAKFYDREGVYSCVLIPSDEGVYKIGNKFFASLWRDVPESPDNRIKSKLVAQCVLTGEITLVKHGVPPTRIIGGYDPAFSELINGIGNLRPIFLTQSYISV